MKPIKYILFFTLFISSLATYSNNHVTIGIAKLLPPFSAIDTRNHYFGFCIDLIHEICKHMKETCEYKAVPPDAILDELEKGTLDISLTPIPISDDLSPDYIFSMPYMTSNGLFSTLNPNIITLLDLKDKKIGIFKASNLKKVLRAYTTNEKIKEYTELNDLIAALMDKSVDAILLNVNIYKYLINNGLIKSRPVGNPINLGNGYGFLALEKNAQLVYDLNQALLNIENDGTYEKIYTKYFGN